ncbi:DUF1330 domain-containing protein [Caulobacter segnis]|uniref:DUF1330 domain-containing protein n=1 Tax=Caulobacter segnis TaxID=88688 RepID=A0A2W5X8I6_9CAUL|nr:DUF1330 domain-containing protein [Caulobacter segnis]PZR37394.1 MAG: hypothetical protein DI526_00410 [Caulobacter segnis]
MRISKIRAALASAFLILSGGVATAQVAAPVASPAAPAAPSTATAPGYLVVSGWYKDAAIQQAYQPAMLKVIRQYDYDRFVVGLPGLNLSVLEGGWTPRFTLIARFPNEQKINQFWWSDAYQQARKIRMGGAYLDVVKVDGGATSDMGPDSAYLIFLPHLTDREKFLKEYAPFAPSVVAQHGGKFLVRTGREGIELLEGDWPNQGMVLVEFPNVAALDAFWNSPEYRRLSEIRKTTGEWSVVRITPAKR